MCIRDRYTDETYTRKWNFDTDTVQSDMVLYAKWVTKSQSGTMTVSRINDLTYTGTAQKPKVEVYDADGQTRLTEGKDYTVSYKNNVNVNAAIGKDGYKAYGNMVADALDADGFYRENPYVIITGKGNYSGALYANFNICEADIEDDETVLAMTDQFDASEKTVKVLKSVKYGKKTLRCV